MVMVGKKVEDDHTPDLRVQLKSLSNRYAVELLHVLSPKTGGIVPSMGWDEIVAGILKTRGLKKSSGKKGEKTQADAEYEKARTRLVSGGTLYESMAKLVETGFVQAIGAKKKKQRRFMITHEGRLALEAVESMQGPTGTDTEVQRAAKLLLKHKNYTRLLPAQKRFISEIGDVEGNLLIQMPPGSGKTFLAMIAILIRLQRDVKCLYLTPYNSLSRQVIDEYGELFENLGYSVIRHDGMHRATEEELQEANLVVGIYESVLHSFLQRKDWVKGFGLVIVDELTELESMVPKLNARNLGTDRSTKFDTLITLLKRDSQIIALSSRFGQTGEVAGWIDARVFRPSVRMQPDEFIVTQSDGYVEIISADGSQSARIKTQHMLDGVLQHLGDVQSKSILVVVGWRKGAQIFAHLLAENHPRSIAPDVIDRVIGSDEDMPVASALRECLKNGVAFHHAGLDISVRDRLERSVRNGEITAIVSTTGITSGTSFSFDCVIILFETISFNVSRSRYSQIAGRIGEYYLAEHGGSVYLTFGGRTRQFQDADELMRTLLHQPLKPLTPGHMYPGLTASLIMREAAKRRSFTRKQICNEFIDLVGGSFRAFIDEEYEADLKRQFKHLFDWLVKKNVIEKTAKRLKLSKESKNVVLAGLNIIDYVMVKDELEHLDPDSEKSDVIDILLDFSRTQAIRPRTGLPSAITVKAAGVEPPEDWYLGMVEGRRKVKKQVLMDWTEEQKVTDILKHAGKLAEEVRIAGGRAAGSDLDEGDLVTLVNTCSEMALDLSDFMALMKRTKIQQLFRRLSQQLKYGVKSDLADTDLFELCLIPPDSTIERGLTREEARLLIDNNYATIEEVVRKDIDPEKKGLARDRFAENSGFDLAFAKEVYKAAILHLRTRRGINE
jgi:replicative superfamily II helicase